MKAVVVEMHKIITNKFLEMQTENLLQEIQQLSLDKKFYLVEEIIKFIKKEELNNQMDMAVNDLYEDYTNDKELTVFTSIDFENFYETK